MANAKRIEAGEYEYRGYRICRDGWVSRGCYGAWVVSKGPKRMFGVDTLKSGKQAIDVHISTKEAKMTERRKRADEAFALTDFGDMVVKDTGNWSSDGDECSMPVFIENGDGPSTKLNFVVRFVTGSNEVSESYFGG